MSGSRRNFRSGLAGLSLRERVILGCLFALLVVYGADSLFTRFYLEPAGDLAAAVTRAEEAVRHQARLLSREEVIHAQYRKLESPEAAVQDSVLTETEVLRELSDLAGRQVHVKTVVPRLGNFEGHQVMFVALDCEGPFAAVVGYVEKILNDMPSEVSSLSLAPLAGSEGGVMCRISIRVDCFEF